ncbi:MAG: DUF4956 domain-containing protein [Gemmatimonadetes bacterium]|nr:DUF4956 domain-containing protein [Gemmatimonadota bacterium]
MATQRGSFRRLWDDLVVRTIGYYIVLIAAAALLWKFVPAVAHILMFPPVVDGAFSLGKSAALTGAAEAATAPRGALDQMISAATAMTVSALLSLPVTWLYILTRQKKGFRQSLVQSMIMLPLVVAGVVVLVKNSLALAFSLAGIVAAVRFRNTLEDSKDAVYVFLATAVGLAAGVDPPVAFAVSFIFNMCILLMWYTDFGRTSAVFEGGVAKQRLEEAKAFAGRQSSFITMLDDEILKSLSAEQLDVVAEKAKKRKKQAAPDREGDDEPTFDVLLRLRTTSVDEAKQVAEAVLTQHLKKWRFTGAEVESGGIQVLEYALRMRKGVTPNVLRDALQAYGSAHIIGVELQ